MQNNDANRCDLHIHSTASDGTCTPEEIVQLAREKELYAIALTDHNTIDGLDAFTEAGEIYGVRTVRGVELTSVYQATEIHILALFLPVESDDSVRSYTNTFLELKAQSNRACVERLRQAGYALDYDDIVAGCSAVSLNRVHIANALLSKGYIHNLQDAFKNLLHPARGYYVPPERIGAFEAIEMIRKWGALPVWAHPGLSLNHPRVEGFVGEALRHGLVGIETRYSQYTQADERYFDDIAKRYHLLASGGSDFHGGNKPDIRLGRGRAKLYVPVSYYEALSAYSQKTKEKTI